MNLSKNHHFNPCFWTANWNFDVLRDLRSGVSLSGKSRDKVIYCWKILPNKILALKTDNCFYNKNANNITIIHDEILKVIQKYASGKNIINNGVDAHSTSAIFSIENLFTDMEDVYKSALLEVIKTGKINGLKTKTMLSFFIFLQSIRSPSSWNYLKNAYKHIHKNDDDGMAIFKMFAKFRQSMENPDGIMDAIIPFLSSKWILYQTDKYLFPLSDHPLLIMKGQMMMPLAPDLLLKILIEDPVTPEDVPCLHRKTLSYSQYRIFRNTSRSTAESEIIFGNERFYRNSIFDYYFCY